jgi:hypothetical protein
MKARCVLRNITHFNKMEGASVLATHPFCNQHLFGRDETVDVKLQPKLFRELFVTPYPA